MATLASRDQALSLLMAANSHTDLAVKLSSLKQAKDILSSLDPSSATELLPYVADLHRSPESLVRLSLLEFVEDIGVKALEGSSVFVPVLLALLRDNDVMVARKSIVKGTNLFVHVLEELMFQFQQYGKVERWLEELWMWMVKFKDAVFSVAVEPGPVGMRLVALKFLEVYVLLFTSDTADTENFVGEATRGNRKNFNVSWLIGGHPVLDSSMLISEGRKVLSVLLDMLQSASTLPGSLTITVVNCLAAIARKRPLHYGTILSALLDFCPKLEPARGPHAASIQYSLRTSYLGFLRSNNPVILESRDRLLRALRTLNAGDAADQVIRQVEKIRIGERGPREARPVRDDQLPSQPSALGELSRKRSMPWDTDETTNGLEVGPKHSFYGPSSNSASPMEGSGHDFASNGSPNVPRSDGDLTPVDQMIAVIGAMLAEGERGAESIEILISKIHPDLLADIVIANMKHLPKSPPPLTRLGNLPLAQQSVSLNGPAQVAAPVATNALQSLASAAQLPLPSFATINSSFSDLPTASNLTVDAKRDPRRDPRRLDPRRASISGGLSSMPPMEESGALQIEFDSSISHKPLPEETVENTPAFTVSDVKGDSEIIEAPSLYDIVQPYTEVENPDATEETLPVLEVNASSSHVVSSFGLADDSAGVEMEDTDMKYDDMSSSPEADKLSPANQNASTSDEMCLELPVLPLYVELSEEQRGALRNLAVQHIIESCVHIHWSDCLQTQMALLARLVSETDTDDSIIFMLGRHIVIDYRPKKGHELVLYILYHLYSLMASSSAGNSPYSALYDKFLLAVAKSLLETFPASDKSFSKLLGEVPFLPPSALKLLDDLCSSDVFDATGKDVRDSERVTQGLGAVWSLIMGRPSDRQACLEIALNCAVHVQDDIRGKAIRLVKEVQVANKLYQLSYISEKIQQFATKMLLCAVDQSPGTESIHSGSTGEKAGPEVGSQETSISGSEVSETGNSGLSPTSMEVSGQGASTMSLPEAQRHISLFFALCTKKPSLLQLTFDTYGRAPKVVKQALHRHIPIVIRALGSSYSELLSIISDPPQGSENLLTHVLQVLSQETTPSPDLISTVKSLYETKLQDATILIPMLSSFSKNEVLPIFPRLVELPLEKFQLALAHILQGSAHTGPALTPAEVLVAIHEIVPEKDGPPLKKIMDACSACFEQRTVFTQQVLAKALNQMVDQTPLPLLFMRTVIQAIDAFPTLVDFVMEVLSKLVSKQVWRMPKLWVGFLKCVAQTQPHSFPVLLQLPPQQLESALNKYASLRGPLSHYASLPNIKSSVPSSLLWYKDIAGCFAFLLLRNAHRTTLAVLGLAKDSTMQPHMSTLNPSETSSSVQGTTLT